MKLSSRIHTPAEDYTAMDDTSLASLRESMLQEVHAIEHQSVTKRALQFLGKGLAAAGVAAGIMLGAKKAYLDATPTVQKSDSGPSEHPLTFTTDLNNIPAGKTLAWSCEGCGGCAGSMGGKCFPALIDEHHPQLSTKAEDGKFAQVSDAQLAEFQMKANFPEKMRERFAKSPENEIVQKNSLIPGVREFLGLQASTLNTSEPKHYRFDSYTPEQTRTRQMAFTTGVSVIGAIGSYSLLDRVMNKPKREHAHHLKHEIQHIEDELSFRERLADTPRLSANSR